MRRNDESSAAVARVQLAEAWRLLESGRVDEALAGCEAVIQAFESIEDSEVQERVAFALLRKGLCLGKLDRPEQEIDAYELLVQRFGDSPDPRVMRHVAWGRYNTAVVCRDLGRLDAAIDGWDTLVCILSDLVDPALRLRVSWSLWQKAKALETLGRTAEAEAAYDRLAERHDDGLEDALDRNIAWCLENLAWRLLRQGEDEKLITVCDDLLTRYKLASDPILRRNVLAALRLRGYGLGRLGRRDRELATYREALSLFEGETDPDMRDNVADTLRTLAGALASVGEVRESLEAYDEGLAYLAATEGPQPRERATDVLFSKAITLGLVDRRTEALVVCDSIAATYAEIRDRQEASSEALWRAVMALIHKVGLLCRLDRSNQAGAVAEQLALVLDDRVEPLPRPAPAEMGLLSEPDLAAKFAEVINSGDYLAWFETPVERPPTEVMERWALSLYSITGPWLSQRLEAWDSPPHIAAAILRELADGYAMLAQPWSGPELARLPLPSMARDRRAALIRQTGVEQWAAEFGYVLALAAASDDLTDESLLADRQDHDAIVEEQWPDFLRQFLTAAYTYQLLEQLRRSVRGREALRSAYFRRYACQEISRARIWSRRVGSPEGVAHLSLAWVIIAEELFIATHAENMPSLFSPPDVVREALKVGGGYELLAGSEVQLPAWMTETEAN